ncbi:MAG: thiamine diphosphokinase [Sedimentibacter sp.]|uniref:thiamine diphosphokinase n=1 Tax=Sedimentibacter sp. TaxID=1960295 RepID=UPI003159934C
MSALIIANGDDVDKKALDGLNIECVICADGGLKKAKALGLTPDIIVGDFDSVDRDLLEKYRSMNIETVKFPVEKDFTDMELSIEIAADKGYRDIVLLGATGGPRLDHSMANMMLLEKYFNSGINIEIIDNNNSVKVVSDGTDLMIDGKKDRFVSLIPLTEEISGLSLVGFKYPLDRVSVKRGSTLCVSNEISEEKGRVILGKGTALLFVSKD